MVSVEHKVKKYECKYMYMKYIQNNFYHKTGVYWDICKYLDIDIKNVIVCHEIALWYVWKWEEEKIKSLAGRSMMHTARIMTSYSIHFSSQEDKRSLGRGTSKRGVGLWGWYCGCGWMKLTKQWQV